MKFGLQATLQAQPGKGEELSTIMLEATQAIAKSEGCELYVIQRSLEDSDKLLITEVWKSQEIHQASLSQPSILEIITKARPLIAGMEHQAAQPLGGIGIQG